MRRRHPAVVLLSALLTFAPGCARVKVDVGLTDTSISGPRETIPAGRIAFAATNTGMIGHELAVYRTSLPPDALPMIGPEVNEQEVTVAGRVSGIQPHETKTLTLTLARGAYVLVCNLPGHYQAGMRAALTVS